MKALQRWMLLASLFANRLIADPVTIIQPCPFSSNTEPDITVTAQYQPVSTCIPTSTCVQDTCITTYSFLTFQYVNTVIPCAWDGTTASSVTITNLDQPVTVSRELQETSAPTTEVSHVRRRGWTAEYGMRFGRFGRLGHERIQWFGWLKSNFSVPTAPTYKDYVVPFRYCGPLAIPGYSGNGIIRDGAPQLVTVIDCTWKKDHSQCVEYTETWSPDRGPTSKRPITVAISASTVVTSPGTHTLTVLQTLPEQTLTADGTTWTVPQQPWYWHTARYWGSEQGDGWNTIDVTVTVTTVLTITVPCKTIPATISRTFTVTQTTTDVTTSCNSCASMERENMVAGNFVIQSLPYTGTESIGLATTETIALPSGTWPGTVIVYTISPDTVSAVDSALDGDEQDLATTTITFTLVRETSAQATSNPTSNLRTSTSAQTHLSSDQSSVISTTGSSSFSASSVTQSTNQTGDSSLASKNATSSTALQCTPRTTVMYITRTIARRDVIDMLAKRQEISTSISTETSDSALTEIFTAFAEGPSVVSVETVNFGAVPVSSVSATTLGNGEIVPTIQSYTTYVSYSSTNDMPSSVSISPAPSRSYLSGASGVGTPVLEIPNAFPVVFYTNGAESAGVAQPMTMTTISAGKPLDSIDSSSSYLHLSSTSGADSVGTPLLEIPNAYPVVAYTNSADSSGTPQPAIMTTNTAGQPLFSGEPSSSYSYLPDISGSMTAFNDEGSTKSVISSSDIPASSELLFPSISGSATAFEEFPTVSPTTSYPPPDSLPVQAGGTAVYQSDTLSTTIYVSTHSSSTELPSSSSGTTSPTIATIESTNITNSSSLSSSTVVSDTTLRYIPVNVPFNATATSILAIVSTNENATTTMTGIELRLLTTYVEPVTVTVFGEGCSVVGTFMGFSDTYATVVTPTGVALATTGSG